MDCIRRTTFKLRRVLLCIRIRNGLNTSELAEWNPELITAEHVNRFELSSSKVLAEIPSWTVQFIHESVRDFLIRHKGSYKLQPEYGEPSESISHNQLKQCCQTYIHKMPHHYGKMQHYSSP